MATIHLCLLLMLCLGVHSSSSEILKRHKRNWIIDSFKIDEGYKGSFPYVLGNIIIEKNYTFFEISGQGVEADPKGILKIDERTGIITVHKPVNFEDYEVLQLQFKALDRSSRVVDTQLGIEILIIDANDNPPKFYKEIYETSIKEATLQGTGITTVNANDDDRTEKFKLFDLKIVSVSPQPSDLEFYITQAPRTGRNTQASRTGTISFRGCLDHEVKDKYTIIVEAKGHGEETQLSSSCTVIINIEDGNNHLPVITGQTGSGRVKEGEEKIIIKRVQVSDQDTEGTPAWKAKYQIQGDKNNNFDITTDNKTNEGILSVVKHLNFEDGKMRNLTISVENLILPSFCQVVRRTTSGLWEVNTSGSATGTGTFVPASSQVTVTVEDVNEAPFFKPPTQEATVGENEEAGKYLATFTAKDADGNTFIYKKGHDPADWITVDPKNGKITTIKSFDRESEYVKDNVYMVKILAIDNGQPPMTGTATMTIHITDENDNTPFLNVSILDVCQSDGLSLANITCSDLDEDPYGGPFTFRLQEKEKGKWKLDPTQGYTVNLVKEPTVHSGEYELLLEVFDRQGERSAHNMSITVCNCVDPARPNCRTRKAASPTTGYEFQTDIGIKTSDFMNKRLSNLQAPGEELVDYAPREYAEEGDTTNSVELDAISILDIPLDPDLDMDLDYKFNGRGRVRRRNIQLETEAAKTGENIHVSHRVLKERNIPGGRALAVSQTFMKRRVYAIFARQWPDQVEAHTC
ncbi:cadherin-like protein 26 [Anoplopoma fimbria]|uniref:cadherin-like protein 26 n=1 Tax=Anoplopoma fimbria TaxID=229290 RepID=UPI0023EA9607|nr:cadherin-like protein 26 [Anoplopoma fimbria]